MHVDSQILRSLVDQTSCIVWSTDSDLRINSVRGGSLTTVGVDAARVVGRLVSEVCVTEPVAFEAHERALSGEKTDLQFDAFDRTWAVHVMPLRGVDGTIAGCLGSACDVTEEREAEKTIIWQSSHDILTGLPNRTAFREILSRRLLQARRQRQDVCLMILDIDGFGSINDAAGSGSGDDALVAVADRLSACAGDEWIVARLSGDEFAVLTPDPEMHVESIAQEVLAAIALPYRIGHRDIQLTVSAGVACASIDGDSPDQLLRSASVAVRRARQLGGNQWCRSSADLTLAAFEKLDLETRIRRGLERGELLLEYQPQVRLSDGEFIGVEALLRWQTGGRVLPAGAFIQAIEDSPTIIGVGEWVIDEACRQLAEWRDAGLVPPRLAMNIGARHFQDPGLVWAVRRAMETHGIDRGMIEIEITETVAMQNAEVSARLIDELRDVGTEISIDDFGTGYSSLAYLRRFAINCVKVDQSFIADLPESRTATAIVNAIVAMANALGLRVIAEGVEREEQVDFLRAIGCTEVQGFHFSRPLSAAAISAKLASGSLPGSTVVASEGLSL